MSIIITHTMILIFLVHIQCDLDLVVLGCIIEYGEFFEWALSAEISRTNSTYSLDDIVEKIKETKFKFLEGLERSEILKRLLNLRVHGKKKHGRRKTKTFNTYEDRWECTDSTQVFGSMIYAILRRLCEDCYAGCDRKVSKYVMCENLYGFHMDHQLKYWKKVNGPSRFYKNILKLLLECIKCRLSCAFCHENSTIPDYETKLQYKNQLKYNFGDKHRTATDVLESKEMRLFILELKARKAFWCGEKIYMSWDTFQCLVWKFFGIVLADVTYINKEKYNTFGYKGWERRRVVNQTIMNIIKKLGVKCPICDDEFGKYNPAELSGVHFDHTSGIKHHEPSNLANYDIDVIVKELTEGGCKPTCCFCHGALNQKTHNHPLYWYRFREC